MQNICKYILYFLTFLEMVCNFVPSPVELKEEKVEGLMCSSALKFDVLPQETRNLKQGNLLPF